MSVARMIRPLIFGFSILFLFVMMPSPSQGQIPKPKTVTLDMQNEPIEAVLEEMSKQLGISITARDEVIGSLVSVTLDKATAKDALAAVVKGHPWEAVTNQMTGNVTIWDRASMTGEASVPAPILSTPAASTPATLPQTSVAASAPPSPGVAAPDSSEPAQYHELTHSPDDAAPLMGEPGITAAMPVQPGAGVQAPPAVVPDAPAVDPAPPVAVEPESPAPAPAAAITPSANWLKNEWGERAMQPFENAPYPHLSREDGWTNKDQTYPRDPHYLDNTVGVFIPKGFVAGDEVNFVVHFHGWMNSVDGVFNGFGLDKQLADSGVNAILLVVQGPKNARDSGGGRLEQDENAFRALIDEAARFLMAEGKIAPTARLGRIVLTAHSGGYRVTSWILKIGGLNDSISDVLLFDASYGDYDNFVNWAGGGQNRRLVSIFTDHLREDNYEMMALLSRVSVRFTLMPVGDMSPDTLQARRPIFIFVPKEEEEKGLGHNEVVSARDFYSLWLRTSALPLR